MSTFLSAPPPADYTAPPPSRPLPLEFEAEFRPQGHEREVWSSIIKSRTALLDQYRHRISPRYVEGFRELGLGGDSPPTIESINRVLKPLQWTATYVDGFIPGGVYAALLNNRIFPVANFLRSPEWIRHSPVPDYIHDVVGHLPQLFSRTLRDYMCRIAGLMAALPSSREEDDYYTTTRRFALLVMNGASPAEVEAARVEMDQAQRLVQGLHTPLSRAGRLFLWTVELGVVGTPDDYRIVGAGLLSSEDELRRIAEGTNVTFEPFDVERATSTDIEFTGMQRRFLLASRFEEYETALDSLSRELGVHA